ncbi:MAG: hypothetical protein QM741_03245 [Rudaea sp.]|uniref:hypothetical protein n=1 Tax=Rudaea sp. TaxID=2136325 RepID=UPI0039E3FF0E
MYARFRSTFCHVAGVLVTGLLAVGTAHAAADTGVNLNQAGLGGTWVGAVAPGHTLTFQVMPDRNGPGKGALLGGWFTFSVSAAADARTQRWYTLQGDAVAGDAAMQLAIYQSSGGDFDAAAKTDTTAAGSATLTFADCDHATLNYLFEDSARGTIAEPVDWRLPKSGAIALLRKGTSATCTAPGPDAVAPGVADLSGAWYDPDKSGQGLFIDIDAPGSLLTANWATYVPGGDGGKFVGTGRQRWYSLRAPISNLASMPGITIFSSVGGTFSGSASATSVVVGTAALGFDDCDHARLDYTFTAGDNAGLQGSIKLAHLGDGRSCSAASLTISGQVNVPAGIDPGALVALGALSETRVDAQGRFTLPRTGAAPSLAGVVHDTGGVVWFGMLDTAMAPEIAFDAHSSAVALLFQAVGGQMLTVDQRREVIRLIEQDPATTTLEQVIVAEQAKNPFVMDNLSAPVVEAINAAVAGWLPSAQSVAALRDATRTLGRVAGLISATDDPPHMTAAAENDSAPQQLLLLDEAEKSGFTLLLGDDNASVRLQNSKRRPGVARVFVTGYTDGSGTHTILPSAQMQGEKTPIPATRRLTAFSAFGSIGSLLSAAWNGQDVATGTIPWSPIESPAISIEGREGAVTTDIDLVVMTGVWNGQGPALAPNYANYADLLGDDLFKLRAKQVFDATIMAILENLGIGGAAVSNLSEDTTIRLLNYMAVPDFDVILRQIREGTSFYNAFRGLLSYFDKAQLESMFEEETYLAALEQYTLAAQEIPTINAVNAAALQFNIEQVETAATNARNKLVNAGRRIVAAVSVVLAGVDTLAQGADQLNGDNQFNTFHLKVVRPTVRLEPRDGKVNLGDSLKLKASVRGFENDPNIKYTWLLNTSDQSVLDDLAGHRVAGKGSFTSKLREVSFITGSLITQSDVAHQVTVRAYVTDSQGEDQLLGTATASITVDGFQVQLTPDSVSMPHDGTRTFGILVTPFPDADTLAALRYEWSAATNGRCGTLTSAGIGNSAAQPVVTTASAHATYAGDASNPANCTADIVHVKLFTMIDGVRKDIGEADATISFIDFDIVFPAISPVQINSDTSVAATLGPPPPADATVVWTWSVSGAASVQSQNDTGVLGSTIILRAGGATGTATITVSATVTLSNGLVENLGAKTRQVQVVNNGTTPVTSGPVQYYTTDQCSIAYVEFPRIANANYYRFTQVSGLGTLGNGPSNNTGGFAAVSPPFTVRVGTAYDVLDTPVALSCALQPSYSLTGTANTVRVVLARALIVDGSPTPSWTAAWEAEFRAAYGSAAIDADAFHSDIVP